jgi:hypothetical protein
MNDLKTPVSRLLRLFRDARDRWRAKALEPQKRLRAAQVPIRDLEHSRAHWKALALAAEGQGLAAELVLSVGLGRLAAPPGAARRWIFVIDETVGLGAMKCLIVLGIHVGRLAEIGYSPRHGDMTVLAVEMTVKSTGLWLGRGCARRGASGLSNPCDDRRVIESVFGH